MAKLLNQGKSFGRETESGKPISTNSDAYAALISMIFDLNCLADQFLLCVDERQKQKKAKKIIILVITVRITIRLTIRNFKDIKFSMRNDGFRVYIRSTMLIKGLRKYDFDRVECSFLFFSDNRHSSLIVITLRIC